MGDGHRPKKGALFHQGHLTLMGISNAPPGAAVKGELIKKGNACTRAAVSLQFNGFSCSNKVKGVGSRTCNSTWSLE